MKRTKEWWESKKKELAESTSIAFSLRYDVGERTVERWRSRIDAKRKAPSKKETRVAYDWETWPMNAKKEIQKVLAKNDEMPDGWRYIPLRKMVGRLRGDWNIQSATRQTIVHYCKIILGRQNWKTK